MTKKQRREIAEIFYAAAEKIETGESDLCCIAIREAAFLDYSLALTIFRNLFERDAQNLGNHKFVFWFQEYEEFRDYPRVRARRVLGLCVAAHLVLEGEIG